MKKKAFKAAFPYTLPICVGFLFLGMSYGFMMRSKGFSFVYPLCMSFFIYAGSMEFVTANLLLSAFNPVYAFFLTLMVNARHLFYGISMLEKYKNTGWKKFYLIFGMCDESFTVNCTVDPPEDVDRGWFMFFVNALNQFYWVTGATAGALLGYVIHFNTKGIDFVMTALFVVMIYQSVGRGRESQTGADRSWMLSDLPGDFWKREFYSSGYGIDYLMFPGNETISCETAKREDTGIRRISIIEKNSNVKIRA